MSQQAPNPGRRRFLAVATSAVGIAGAAATAFPFVRSMQSAKDTLAMSTTEVEIGLVELGQMIVVPWQGKPVFIVHRTEEMLGTLDARTDLKDPMSDEPEGGDNPEWFLSGDEKVKAYRAQRPEWYISSAVCTHLGCVPLFTPEIGDPEMGGNWQGGWHCPCHGSKYDLAGRVIEGSPAPRNLQIMKYAFMSDTTVLIG